MCSNVFEIGRVYHATPAFAGQPRKLARLIERDERNLMFDMADELADGEIAVICERETAKIVTRIGVYNVSAAVVANARVVA